MSIFKKKDEKKMKTILIPVDFSEGSMNSCKYALFISGKEKVIIHLYHIYNDQVMIPDSSFPSGLDTDTFFNADIILALKEQAERSMQELVDTLKEFIKKEKLQATISFSLEGGDPQWEITEAIKETKPDFVVMGTRGTGKKGFLEGHMAEKIMRKASVPVIAVPENFTNFNLSNILYLTDFNSLDIFTIERIFSLFNSKTFKLHVYHLVFNDDDKKANLLMQELEKAFDKEKKENKISFSILNTNNKQETLNKISKDNKIDMIALLSEKKHSFKDLFSSHEIKEKDLFELKLPVIELHTTI